MIFRTSLVRELVITSLAIFFVLVGIIVTTQLVRLLGQAAGGTIDLGGVALLLALALLAYLPLVLSLTLFVAVLMTLTRSYRDSEMVVWFACGMSLTEWIRPVLMLTVPIVVLIALSTLVVRPWAVANAEELRRRLENRDDVSMVTPGVFRESNRGDRVFFVEKVSGKENVVGNVFVSSIQHNRQGVMVAAQGFTETAPNGDRFLVLRDGRRYEGEPGTAAYKIYEFERYAMRIEVSEAQRAPTEKSVPTLELVRDPTRRNLGELSFRLGVPIGALILALLAIPLSFVNPRAGRSMNLLLALLVYMSYSNMLSIAEASIGQSRVSFATGVFGVHAVMFLLLLLLFYRRLMLFSLFRLTR
ncbi:MAG: LPS export ABC transporter permease LptF [Betaproteobacteria bacterium]|jgi:lipopolysaccharide export system permease protein|nr:MAG: LPS export ABC transporter permease LptF [Betaproteobacteria bacterium SG8_41]UCF75116.1 MAG: LPS export ABC transporter permease LptF [Betaproteobacteria bacterium]